MSRSPGLTRRRLIAAPALATAAWAGFGRAHGLPLPEEARGRDLAAGGLVENDRDGRLRMAMHAGAGEIEVKFFSFGQAPRPNLFLSYLIPPGCGEGVHVHRLGDAVLGAYDEYYYIVSGSGVMELEGRSFPVQPGDHVHAPLGSPHGIANPSRRRPLKLLLTAVERS